MNYEKLWKELYETLEESIIEVWYCWQVTDLMDDMVAVAKMEEESSMSGDGEE